MAGSFSMWASEKTSTTRTTPLLWRSSAGPPESSGSRVPRRLIVRLLSSLPSPAMSTWVACTGTSPWKTSSFPSSSLARSSLGSRRGRARRGRASARARSPTLFPRSTMSWRGWVTTRSSGTFFASDKTPILRTAPSTTSLLRASHPYAQPNPYAQPRSTTILPGPTASSGSRRGGRSASLRKSPGRSSRQAFLTEETTSCGLRGSERCSVRVVRGAVSELVASECLAGLE
ncbi:hypothetical protein T484DRAFT_1941441 [Baffinella frigidus]|nr:hypothetical protein T484DRAFT_1941441 [Cryptophyta sp. CCMP2293]|mmetsp:Transcript_17747/g.42896  ORF Transcript_17747/g.42896 Transcript_17747/m.42896 type:complete len:231 (-) Transcript_17747:24-716(-)